MPLPEFMTTRDVAQMFEQEIEGLGGSVSDRFDDRGCRLFMRSVLPGEREVRSGDALRGGVAMMADEREIRLHPYVFRVVCSNGAIMAHAIETRRIEIPTMPSEVEYVASTLREAVRACGSPGTFARSTGEIRSAVEADVDMALAMMPMLSRLGDLAGADAIGIIMRRYLEGADRSRFGLMNAVTSVARDTRDPESRWRLEELGGGIPSALEPVAPRRTGGAAMPLPQRGELVTA
ncbi:MAG TPA: hypothetical protein VH475_22220 [Tepidisphaeraceae bacterium]|jgi:hypothetical protein